MKTAMTNQTRHALDDRMLTMQEAIRYLSERGFSCKSRTTFYRVIKQFDIPYTNMNPEGTNEVRRFPLSGLQKFLESQGLNP